MESFLSRLDGAVLHRGRIFVTGFVPEKFVVSRMGAWTEVDVAALAALAERLGRSVAVIDRAILERLAS